MVQVVDGVESCISIDGDGLGSDQRATVDMYHATQAICMRYDSELATVTGGLWQYVPR